MANEIATKPEGGKLAVAAGKIADLYLNEIANLNTAVGVPLTDEAKRCGSNVILQLCAEVGAAGVQAAPKAQLVQVLQFVTINGLDVFSGQVFLDKRKDKQGNITSIKATPMGNAYEIMTRRFGVDVKRVHPARIVHEGDEFALPQFDGLKMTNVVFKPTLKGLDGKAIAVYYIIEKTDGSLDFAVATREGVAKNLMAQILNATLRLENVNRKGLMEHLEGKSLDELLSDPTLAEYISPAYRSPATREQMIITKMKKNALLHYTRDLGVNNSEAYAKANKGIDDDDMVIGNNVVDVQDPEAEAKPAQKIADFDVDDDGVEEAKTPANPEPNEEKPIQEAKEVEAHSEEPKKEEKQTSIFDIDDL